MFVREVQSEQVRLLMNIVHHALLSYDASIFHIHM